MEEPEERRARPCIFMQVHLTSDTPRNGQNSVLWSCMSQISGVRWKGKGAAESTMVLVKERDRWGFIFLLEHTKGDLTKGNTVSSNKR